MIERALKACKISATPFAKTTTREAVKLADVVSEIDLTSS
jgi:hypothetical protein